MQECKECLVFEIEGNPEQAQSQHELLAKLELEVPGLEFLKQPLEVQDKWDLIRQARAA